MKTIHVANTEFEYDLRGATRPHLSYLLSFLPTLYREEREGVLVYGKPPTPIEGCVEKRDLFTAEELIPWGYSPWLVDFAAAHHIPYHPPSWELTKRVNSKLFSFENSPPLPGAQVLSAPTDFRREGPWIFKSPYGASGMGKVIVQEGPLLEAAIRFCERVWERGELVVAEPWVNRLLDFSSQWMICREKIELIGMTKMKNSPHGAYLGSVVGEDDELFGKWVPLVEEHKAIARGVLEKMQVLGYYGPVGVDAFIWGEGILHPVVEINARQTMALVALKLQRKQFPGRRLELLLAKSGEYENPLLPERVQLTSGKFLTFQHNLYARL